MDTYIIIDAIKFIKQKQPISDEYTKRKHIQMHTLGLQSCNISISSVLIYGKTVQIGCADRTCKTYQINYLTQIAAQMDPMQNYQLIPINIVPNKPISPESAPASVRQSTIQPLTQSVLCRCDFKQLIQRNYKYPSIRVLTVFQRFDNKQTFKITATIILIEFDRDVALFKIAENSTFNNKNINNMPTNPNSNSIMNLNTMGGLNWISKFNNTISTYEKASNLQQNNQYQQNPNYNYQFIQQPNSPPNSNPMKLQLKNNQKYLQNPFASSLQQQNKIKTKRSINQLKKQQNSKKQPPYSFKTHDPKNNNSSIQNNPVFNTNIENNTQAQSISSARKNKQKIKITQKLVKKNNANNFNNSQASLIGINNDNKNHIAVTQNNNNNLQFNIREEQILIINNSNNFTPKNYEKKNNLNDKNSNNNNQQFLNIFDDEQDGTISQPQAQKMQHSSPDIFIQNSNKNRPATNYKKNQHKQNKQAKQDRKDLPSINLRGSFQQLQNYVPNQITSNKKIKQKLKTQINRDFSYQYPKSRQKTQTQKGQIRKSPPKETFPEQIQQSLLTKQLNELKKQNSDLRKQLQNMYTMAKQNNSLKKKYYQLNEEVSRLEMERKEILADKLKCQANYHKQKLQKEHLKNQLEEMIKLLEFANLNNMMNGSTMPNIVDTHSNNNLLILNHQNHKQNQQQSYNNSSNPLPTSYEQNRKKIYNLIFSPTLKKNFLNQLKQKNLNPINPISSNHSIAQNMERTFDSNMQFNTQSRKQLRLPAYSYKYNNNVSTNNIK